MNQKSLDKQGLEKQIEWILANRICYIGNEIPECFTTDKRSKSLYLGCPQDMIDEIKSFIQSELNRQVEEITDHLQREGLDWDYLNNLLKKKESK